MDYTIEYSPTGTPRVRINGVLYPLKTTGGHDLATWSGRQQMLVESGQYGDDVAAYARACAEVGLPCNLGWEGVINSLGDHGRVTLPTPFVEE